MPAQPPTTFRIEDLKARLKLEPKSRLFYPLAEELRKLDRFADAEKVLRDGLKVHGAYVSAWISLGRVLLEQQKYQEAMEILQKACTLDPGNVVAARLLADAYAALGQPVEAIKKYKLVRALMPSDEEVQDIIARLEVQIHRAAESGQPVPSTAAQASAASPVAAPPPQSVIPRAEASTASPLEGEPFVADEPPVPITVATGGDVPVRAIDVDAAMGGKAFTSAMSIHPEEIVPPRTEAVNAKTRAEDEPDFPLMQTNEAPFSMSEAPPMAPPGEDVFAHSSESLSAEPAAKATSDPLLTKTMADLYAQQGHQDDAREIYTRLSGTPQSDAKDERKPAVMKLESWLLKMGRK